MWLSTTITQVINVKKSICALHWQNDNDHFYVKIVNTSVQINTFVCQTQKVNIILTDNVCICCLQQLNSFIKCIMIAIFNNQIINNSVCVNCLWKKQFNHCFLCKWLFFLHLIWLIFLIICWHLYNILNVNINNFDYKVIKETVIIFFFSHTHVNISYAILKCSVLIKNTEE